MKFKVGDKVIYKRSDTQLLGRITQIRDENSLIDYQVCIRDLEKDTQTFVWATSKELRLFEEYISIPIAMKIPNDTIEPIAMVKTKEEIKLEELEKRINELEEQMKDCIKYSQCTPVPKEELELGGYHTIKGTPDIKICGTNEETKPSLLTKDERVILRNVDRVIYRWIARDKKGNLDIFERKPNKEASLYWSLECWDDNGGCRECFNAFEHLFQFIKWEDEQPYNIEELLEGND